MGRYVIGIAIVAALTVGTAYADPPVTFRLQSQVTVGNKPQIELIAGQSVADVRIDLVRNDGKKFTLRSGAMAAGQVVHLIIGDGSAGKASYKATITAGTWTDKFDFDTAIVAPIKLTYDADHLDLDKRQLQFKASRPVASADLVVFGEDGKELGKGAQTFAPPTNDGWLAVSWTQPANTRVATMKLRVAAGDGSATNLELIPWSVVVDHEDVNFVTDKSTIEASETAKLDASLSKINEIIKRVSFVKMQLYVAGHTDTVGPNDKNLRLSSARALAIAKYFRGKGLAIPIVIAGFGEEVLKVSTPQDTDERANRRADYVLGPVGGTPPFGAAYRKVRAQWTPVK